MNRFPRYLRATIAGLLVAGFTAPGAAAQVPDLGSAVQESYPTNMSMLSRAAGAAVNELFLGFNATPGAVLLVEAETKHQGNWFIEDLILTRLTEAGYHAYLKEPEPEDEADPAESEDVSGKEEPAEEADLDSSNESPEAGMEVEKAVAEELPEPGLVFRYRLVEFGILYPEAYRKSPFGSKKVQRHAAVKVSARLLEGARERIQWIGQGDAERLDVVPAGKLSLLEGNSFPFDQPELDTRGLGAFVEPALVTGIVAGLIYLFYTNQD